METYFICANCGEENEIVIDLTDGEHQELIEYCQDCEQPNRIIANYNHNINDFDLDVFKDN